MDTTSKEIWISMFDENLEKFMSESDLIRDFAMVFHVMQLKYYELRNHLAKLQNNKEVYSKEICNCSRSNTRFEDSDATKLSGISKLQDEIVIISEESPNGQKRNRNIEVISVNSTPKHDEKTVINESIFEDSLNFLEDDKFNQPISELDLQNIDPDESMFNDTTTEQKNLVSKSEKALSPKLNKNKRISRAIKLKLSKSVSPNDSFELMTRSKDKTPSMNGVSIICETPDICGDRFTKLKPVKLKMTNNNLEGNILKDRFLNSVDKNESTMETSRRNEKRLLSFDETLCGTIHSTSEDEIDIDVMLNDLNKTQVKTPKKKLKLSAKENIFDNAYKRLHIKKEIGPKYYKEVVRKKSEREKLPGWDCEDCEKYYKNLDLGESERKKIMNACSRHKSKHKHREILTPEGYWKPDFTFQSQNQ